MRTVIAPILFHPTTPAKLVEHLHAVREHDRITFARRLHDDVGSMLIAVAMELGAAEARSPAPQLRETLRRLGEHLADAININRRTIEELRPTLLDTFGLFEALKWCFKNACQHHPARCRATLPDEEIRLRPHQLTHVFRAALTLLDCTLSEERLMTIDLAVRVSAGTLAIRIGHQHIGKETHDVLDRFELELASASHRIAALGGELTLDSSGDGALYSVLVPLDEDRPACVKVCG